jgi:hypothetical protein
VLVSAGLLLSSLRKLQQVDAGFRKENMLMLGIRADNYKVPLRSAFIGSYTSASRRFLEWSR